MRVLVRRFIISLVASGWFLSVTAPAVEASCGSVSCFVVIGSQQQVPIAGLLTVNAIYNITLRWKRLQGKAAASPLPIRATRP